MKELLRSASSKVPVRTAIELLFVFVPKLLTGAGTILINLVLLRCMDAEQFGVLGICTTTILLVDGIVGSAVDMGVMKQAPLFRESDPDAFHGIQREAFLAKGAAGLLLLAPLLVFRDPLSEALFHRQGLGAVIALTCVTCLLFLLWRTTQLQLQLEGRFRAYGTAEIIHGLLRFGGIAILIVTQMVEPLTVLLAMAVPPFVLLAVWAFKNSGGILTKKAPQPTIRHLYSVLSWYLLTFGLGAVISRMDIYLLARFSDLRAVGLYSAAQTLALLVQLAGTYVGVVFGPKVAPLIEQGRFAAYFRTFQTGLIATSVAIYFLFQCLWAFGADALFPARYLEAGPLLNILLIGSLAGFATFPLTLTFVMFVRPRALFAIDCIYFPVLIVLYFRLLPQYGAIGAAWITAGANLSRAILIQVLAWSWASELPQRPQALAVASS